MTFDSKLAKAVGANDSLVCVGLDPELGKLPVHIASQAEPLFAFNKEIIDSTADLVCAYKPNSAFYEAYGADGISQLKKTTDYIGNKYPHIPILLDSKRADIGNTNEGYVTHSFDYLGVDAVTLHPYLGQEALKPFLERDDKGCIILCRTSNPGAGEFQDLQVDGKPLYQHVARQVAQRWNKNSNCLLVVGATYPGEMRIVREIAGSDITFLVPGIGAQGGDLEAVMTAGINADRTGLIISSSRGIIYAGEGEDFAAGARQAAQELRDEINKFRR